jgi:hypothetical protein
MFFVFSWFRGRFGVAALAGALILLFAAAPGAHDIPNDVTLQMFVKPEGSTLRIIVREPLATMRDMEFRRQARGSDINDLSKDHPTRRESVP